MYGVIESVTLINRENNGSGGMWCCCCIFLFSPHLGETSSNNAFAFVKYTDPLFSAAAIEAENGQEWLGCSIRVQYCESVDKKAKYQKVKYTHKQQKRQTNTFTYSPQL